MAKNLIEILAFILFLHILQESPNMTIASVHNVTNYFPNIEQYSVLKSILSEEAVADTEWRKDQ